MSAVIQFLNAAARHQQREAAVASEVNRMAAVKGYASRSAVGTFKRDALKLAQSRPDLSPSACAARSVPDMGTRLGDGPEDAA